MHPTIFFTNQAPRDLPGSSPYPGGVAYFSDSQGWYSGVRYGGSPMLIPIPNQDLSTVLSWIGQEFKDLSPIETDYKPGTAYKRMFRTFAAGGSLNRAIDENAMNESFVALELLYGKLERIFRMIEPVPTNAETYGHETREILLLAAMEVENSWTAVLKANGYTRQRMTTQDYVKLLSPMLLDAYTLSLSRYPSYPSFAPFTGWMAAAPTQSLSWYDAYNATKHNREQFLDRATLRNCISAVGAVTVMYHAQFGGYVFRPGDERERFSQRLFNFRTNFDHYPTSCYIPNAVSQPGTPSTSVWDWNLIDFPFA